MKIKFIIMSVVVLLSFNAFSQTLFVPSGTAGIGSSQTSFIGIGTSAPSYKFHVNSTVNGWASVIHNQGCYVYSSNAIGSTDGYGMQIKVNNSRNDRYALYLTSGTNNIFYARNDGNIGIGTTSPLYKLHVNGSIFASGITSDNIGAYGYGTLVNTTSETAKAFCVYSGATGQEVFLVRGNGVMNAKKIYAEAFEVTPNALEIGWFDHVFADSYELKPLSEVESYVKENKHLPDLPSEQTIKSEGFDLLEMDGLLLKKIEELTLYVIQQQKEIELLKQQVNK